MDNDTELTEDAPAEEAEAAPTVSHKGAKVLTVQAGGIERYDCSAGDFQTFADAETVQTHITNAK